MIYDHLEQNNGKISKGIFGIEYNDTNKYQTSIYQTRRPNYNMVAMNSMESSGGIVGIPWKPTSYVQI